jgi:DNA-binding winged helix-turn-helix (wHTH) protein/tetratricopeptide (TPR) repeat protein
VSSRRLRFDGWVLDPESGDLERGGTRIRLQEQPVQVLRELIAHAGSVVPREQLIALLWPNGVVDFDTGLNTVIRKLRSALGDTSQTPRYIETLPRRGYRFIGTLDPDPEAASAASPTVPGSTAFGASPGPAPPSHHEPTALPGAALAAPTPMPSGREPAARDEATSSTATTTAPVRRPPLPVLALIAALAGAVLLTGVYALWRARSGASVGSVRVEAPSQSGLPAKVARNSAVAFATRNPAAFDSYLRASEADEFGHDAKDLETAIAGYSEAIRLDPNYALAFASRSIAWIHHAEPKGTTVGEDTQLKKALADARQAVTLAPELAEGHLALHLLFSQELDFAQASVEVQRAVALAPGNANVLVRYGRFAVLTGHTDAGIDAARRAVIDGGIAAARRAVILDPLNHRTHYRLGDSLYFARRYAEAVAAFSDVLVLAPQAPDSAGRRGLAYYGLGDFERARASCDARPDDETGQVCLAITYQRLARHADAETALAKMRAPGDRWAYDCAAIYAQWGNTSQALESLESAWRLRVPELRWLKADPLMDPLRKEPRFQAIERALNFPN